MKIEKNRVISIRYEMKSEAGELLGTTENGAPVSLLFGHGGLLPKLEEALEGKEKGDDLSITLLPEDAWGPRDEKLVQTVPLSAMNLPDPKALLQVGMIVQLNDGTQDFQARVVQLDSTSVRLDLNNPFAGKALVFEIKVESVRQATEEEIAHGHVH